MNRDTIESERSSLAESTSRQYNSIANSNPRNAITDEEALEALQAKKRRNFTMARYTLSGLLVISILWILCNVIEILTGLSLTTAIGGEYGSGFDILLINFLSFGYLETAAIFPSDRLADSTLAYLTIGLQWLCCIIILATSQLRHRIGLLNIFLASLLFSGSTIVGLVPLPIPTSLSKRWSKNLCRLVIRGVCLVLIVLYFLNTLIDAKDSYTHTSEMVSTISGVNVHLTCTPAGLTGPVAIIEGGESSSEHIHHWMQNVKGFKAICSWDRPGFGLSDNAPNPLSMASVGEYLEAALQQQPYFQEPANEDVVLISAGVGSLYSRVFAARSRVNLRGVIFIDPLHEDLFYSKETTFKGIKHFFEGLSSLVSFKKFKQILSGYGTDDRLFGELAYHQPRYHKALLQEQIYARGASTREIRQSMLPTNLPLLLLSSSEMCEDRSWSRYQRLHLQLTKNPIAWKIISGPHDIWLDPQGRKELIFEIEEYIAHGLIG